MKYTLDERSILNEKYILKEKFYLFETLTTQEKIHRIANVTQDVLLRIEKAYKIINSLNKKEAEKKLNTLEKQLISIPDTNDKTTKLRQFASALTAELNKISSSWKDLVPELSDNLNNFTTAINLDMLRNLVLKVYSIENYDMIISNFEKTINKLKSINNTINSWEQHLDSIENDAAVQSLIDKQNNLCTKLASNSKSLIHWLEKFKFDNLLSTLEQIYKNLVIETEVQTRKYDSEHKSIENKNNKTTLDWKQKFYDAANQGNGGKDSKSDAVAQVWDEYFSTEWAGYEDHIKFLRDIMPTLTIELNTYGYTEKDNPFIIFLKRMLKNSTFSDEVSKKIIKYSTIHNNVARNMLSARDIAGIGVLGETNIVLNADLYTHSEIEIQKYIQLQKLFIDTYEKRINNRLEADFSSDTTNKLITKQNKILDNYKNNIKQFIIDSFFKAGDIMNNIKGSFNNKLYDANHIEDTFKKIFGKEELYSWQKSAEEDKKPKITEKNIDEVLNQIKQISNSESKETFEKEIKLLAYLLCTWWTDVDESSKNSIITNILKLKQETATNIEAEKMDKKYLSNYNINALKKNQDVLSILLANILNKFLNVKLK